MWWIRLPKGCVILCEAVALGMPEIVASSVPPRPFEQDGRIAGAPSPN